jgi:hypothetical protein
MSAGIWFWLFYVLCVVFGIGIWYPWGEDTRRHLGASLIILILIGLLGWGVFGPPIK